jgi:2-polyprenyl-6-hydroxyphenyl methylase/3-demethylubiquinone-9 3-methyltransferase
MTAPSHAREVAAGERFAFGKNWARFLELLDDSRIASASTSLARLLGTNDLTGLTFLDIGSGSGLSSLAAFRLGASVTAFDYDPDSVACTHELRRRYAPDSARWRVQEGSALDDAFMSSLGSFDLVHSWGVLHHTGSMWHGVDLACARVAPRGTLVLALYNDQGSWSPRWRAIKKFYCSGTVGRWAVSATFISWWIARGLAADIVWRRNPLARYQAYSGARGMSVVRDWHDWLGGYPFEFAKPEEVVRFCRERGFILRDMVTAGGSVGCNEFVFERTS